MTNVSCYFVSGRSWTHDLLITPISMFLPEITKSIYHLFGLSVIKSLGSHSRCLVLRVSGCVESPAFNVVWPKEAFSCRNHPMPFNNIDSQFLATVTNIFRWHLSEYWIPSVSVNMKFFPRSIILSKQPN